MIVCFGREGEIEVRQETDTSVRLGQRREGSVEKWVSCRNDGWGFKCEMTVEL